MKFSVVIPNYNGRHLLEKNLPAVLKACRAWGKTDWEVIVVDDASTDDSVDFLQASYPQIKVVRHKKNLRFAKACNSGVRAAKGEIIVLLNSDVSPRKDFLKFFVGHFDDPQIFAVGCREKEERSGKIIHSGRGIMKFRRGLVVHWRAEDQNAKTTSWVCAAAGAFDREKWLKLGGMDTLFRPAYEEDRDLSYRALKHGWKILFEPKSLVFHCHETTNIQVFGKIKIQLMSFKNQFLFVWKNITDSNYLLRHFLWLPYHLLVTNSRTRGLLGIGFLWALTQLPEVCRARRAARKFFIKKDSELI